MAKHKKKQRNHFYAVANGRCLPSVFTSWCVCFLFSCIPQCVCVCPHKQAANTHRQGKPRELLPTISRFQAARMVNHCPRNTHEGFNTFDEAKAWLLARGHATFYFVEGCSDGPKAEGGGDDDSAHGSRCWYAVARGRRAPGLYSTYRTAKLQVEGYPNAIFKAYATEAAARAALEGAAVAEDIDDDNDADVVVVGVEKGLAAMNLNM